MDFEITAINLYIKNNKIILIRLYRFPSVASKTFLDIFEKLLNLSKLNNLIIAGDLNIDSLSLESDYIV